MYIGRQSLRTGKCGCGVCCSRLGYSKGPSKIISRNFPKAGLHIKHGITKWVLPSKKEGV